MLAMLGEIETVMPGVSGARARPVTAVLVRSMNTKDAKMKEKVNVARRITRLLDTPPQSVIFLPKTVISSLWISIRVYYHVNR